LANWVWIPQLDSTGQSLDVSGACLGLKFCRNLPDGKARAYKLLAQAVALDPHAAEPYVEMGQLLLPRWAGEKGELDRFLRDHDRAFGGGLLGVVALNLIKLSGVEEEQGYTPAKILASLEILARNRPSAYNRNLFASAAANLRRRDYARRALARLGGDWDRMLFLNSEAYASVQKWANRSGREFPLF